MFTKAGKLLTLAVILAVSMTGCEMTCREKPETTGEKVGKVIDSAVGDADKTEVKIKVKDKD